MIKLIGDMLRQWEVGRIVEVDDDVTEIQFANQYDTLAIPVVVVDGRATIPAEFLQTGKPVVAFGVKITADDEVVVCDAIFPVKDRPRPADYIYEPVEPYTVNKAVQKALQEAAVNLDGYVKNTDIATADAAGVVRCGEGLYMTSTGKINVSPATETHIDAKTTHGRCVTPANLDYAVKVGLTTNHIDLTDEEKAAAQAWLGLGNIEAALDGIIAIQNELIGGAET